MFSFDCLVFLLRYTTLVMNPVNTNSYSREHTEIACICRAVIDIGTAHMTFLTVETKIIAGI